MRVIAFSQRQKRKREGFKWDENNAKLTLTTVTHRLKLVKLRLKIIQFMIIGNETNIICIQPQKAKAEREKTKDFESKSLT